jgi:glycosyltransferase involved in cell wall biosynthesis
VNLAIEAMRFVSMPIRLVIAGSGEDEDALRKSARVDPRVEFRGRVTDEELSDLYSNALAVAFVPIREDYGYITLEAFRSGKAVITCTDSGEAARIVNDEVNGLIVAPDPAELGMAFGRLAANRQFAATLGAAGLVRERQINWEVVAPALLDALDLLREGAS